MPTVSRQIHYFTPGTRMAEVVHAGWEIVMSDELQDADFDTRFQALMNNLDWAPEFWGKRRERLATQSVWAADISLAVRRFDMIGVPGMPSKMLGIKRERRWRKKDKKSQAGNDKE